MRGRGEHHPPPTAGAGAGKALCEPWGSRARLWAAQRVNGRGALSVRVENGRGLPFLLPGLWQRPRRAGPDDDGVSENLVLAPASF